MEGPRHVYSSPDRFPITEAPPRQYQLSRAIRSQPSQPHRADHTPFCDGAGVVLAERLADSGDLWITRHAGQNHDAFKATVDVTTAREKTRGALPPLADEGSDIPRAAGSGSRSAAGWIIRSEPRHG
jgi:hypothetical protein